MTKRTSLQCMTGIHVVVEDLGPELKGLLTRRDIRGRVEAQLGAAGIRTISRQAAARLPGEPYLYINLAALPVKRQQFACRIDVEVHQQVALVHDANAGHATTWEQGILTIGDPEAVIARLDELVFQFICDYLAVHPGR